MTKAYDATKEFTPFANRSAGGAITNEPTYKGHPNKKGYRKSAGKPNTSRHAPNHRVLVPNVGSHQLYLGYHWVRADGSKVQSK
jgi:hypothetical protein